MTDTTANADTGAQTSAPASSVEDRLSAFFGGGEAPDEQTSSPEAQPEPPAQESQAQDVEAADDEVTPEDVPADDDIEPSQTSDDLELTYNGESLKVSKSEAKDLAQLGLHTKRNQDRIAAEMERAQETSKQLQQLVNAQLQAAPAYRQADLEAGWLAQQLQSIDHNALARLATDDPAQYVQVRAQIDALQGRFNAAYARREQALQQFEASKKEAAGLQMSQEYQLLTKLVPIFKDSAKAQTAREQVVSATKAMRNDTVNAIANNAELMALAYKAARYDALQASKREKVATAQKAPSVAKPGAGQPADAGRVEQTQKLRNNLRKSGSVQDAARLLAMRMR